MDALLLLLWLAGWQASLVPTGEASFAIRGIGVVGNQTVFAPEDASVVGLFDVSLGLFVRGASIPPPASEVTKKFFGALTVGDTVIFTPRGSGAIGVYHVPSNDISLVPLDIPGSFSDSVVVGDKVIFAPLSAEFVGVFDVSTGKFEASVRPGPSGSGTKFASAASVGTKVVFSPLNAPYVGIFDAVSNSFQSIALPYLGSAVDFFSTAVAVGSKVVLTPRSGNFIGVLDVHEGSLDVSVSTATLRGSNKFLAAVRVGVKVIMAPFNAAAIGVYDVELATFTMVETSFGQHSASFFTIAAIGTTAILCPYDANSIGVFEVNTSNLFFIPAGGLTMNNKFANSVVVGNQVICSPRHAGVVAVVHREGSYIPRPQQQCTDTCPYASDSECDDGGYASLYSSCTFGTDCSDCGPRAYPPSLTPSLPREDLSPCPSRRLSSTTPAPPSPPYVPFPPISPLDLGPILLRSRGRYSPAYDEWINTSWTANVSSDGMVQLPAPSHGIDYPNISDWVVSDCLQYLATADAYLTSSTPYVLKSASWSVRGWDARCYLTCAFANREPVTVGVRLDGGANQNNHPVPSACHNATSIHLQADARSTSRPPTKLPAGAAGNDPIFVGADGIPYRVDGQAGRAFNLISSPCLSVNSEVQEVPPRFQYPRLGLTSTVFGSMHVSVGCRNITEQIGSDGLWWNNSRQTRVDARFDVLSGTILCRMLSKGQREVSCDTVPGLQVAEYYRECDLEDMTCDWFPVSAKWSRSLYLAHVQPGITQTRLHIGNSVLVFTRDSLRHFNNVPCDDFRRWPKAREACHMVAQHLSAAGGPQNDASLSEEMIQRYLAILAAYHGMLVPAHMVFFFYHLTVEHLDTRDFSNPALLHGLLGQRLLSPRPVQNRSSTVIHPDHILKSAGAVNILVSDLSSQGEGFIEGTYHDYMVPTLDNHCAFPFSQFMGDEC